jgi:hypothetical protein
MNTMLTIAIIGALLAPPGVIMAQGSQNTRQIEQNQAQKQAMDPATVTPETNREQNQNEIQIQTQNQAEDTQLMIATQQMQQLMEMDGMGEETGTQVREIAGQQAQSQSQIQVQVENLDLRPIYMKRLFGPDYKTIDALNRHMEQNTLRIQQLETLANQVTNQADQTRIREAVRALVEQNTALQTRIQSEEGTGSLFGWLIRLFRR